LQYVQVGGLASFFYVLSLVLIGIVAYLAAVTSLLKGATGVAASVVVVVGAEVLVTTLFGLVTSVGAVAGAVPVLAAITCSMIGRSAALLR
jgi:hypothetical protein